MKTNDQIILGPLLGLEDRYHYSISIFSRTDLDETSLMLSLIYFDNFYSFRCYFKQRVNNIFFYKFSFDISELQLPEINSTYIKYQIIYKDEVLINQQDLGEWRFVVPGRSAFPKIGFGSCNGTSILDPVKEKMVRASKNFYKMWEILLHKQPDQPLKYAFHCMILCGDQVYADTIWEKVEYLKKNRLNNKKAIIDHQFTPETLAEFRDQINDFYENLYLESWNNFYISMSMASIPMIMMWDDHDIFDGWGSHGEELQNSEVFKQIFSVAKKYFEVFQIKGRNNRSLISGSDNYSQRISFRNNEIMILDNRSNRTEHQIMSENQYSEIEKIKNSLFDGIRSNEKLNAHKTLNFVLPVPIAHLNYKTKVEQFLNVIKHRKFNNNLNDDSLDHWDHHKHKTEQKRMIDLMFEFGAHAGVKYINVISGDVHAAGSAKIISKQNKVINQIISSGIIHRPIGRFKRFIISNSSKKKSEITNYNIQIFNFGKLNQPVIYERNFGFLFKANKSPLKAYLYLENEVPGDNKYYFDVPWLFENSSALDKDLKGYF